MEENKISFEKKLAYALGSWLLALGSIIASDVHIFKDKFLNQRENNGPIPRIAVHITSHSFLLYNYIMLNYS